jgi:UDP-N-acetyl-D-mannosaminuronate dehydrogenase
LAALGADVRIVDPHLVGDSVPYPMVELTDHEVEAADAVVIVTDHDAFDYDLVASHATYVLDTRNRLVGTNIERL